MKRHTILVFKKQRIEFYGFYRGAWFSPKSVQFPSKEELETANISKLHELCLSQAEVELIKANYASEEEEDTIILTILKNHGAPKEIRRYYEEKGIQPLDLRPNIQDSTTIPSSFSHQEPRMPILPPFIFNPGMLNPIIPPSAISMHPMPWNFSPVSPPYMPILPPLLPPFIFNPGI